MGEIQLPEHLVPAVVRRASQQERAAVREALRMQGRGPKEACGGRALPRVGGDVGVHGTAGGAVLEVEGHAVLALELAQVALRGGTRDADEVRDVLRPQGPAG